MPDCLLTYGLSGIRADCYFPIYFNLKSAIKPLSRVNGKNFWVDGDIKKTGFKDTDEDD